MEKYHMHAFNGGKPYHGSKAVAGGKLRGLTDSDYFYFLCPCCADNTVLQIVDFTVRDDGPVKYAPENRPKAKRDFTIVLKLWCHTCHLEDFVKVSNTGWQGGKITNQICPPPGLYTNSSGTHT
jgi:hypothetical protein